MWAADGRKYNPDFIALDNGGGGWLIEVKADKDLNTADVLGRREAAKRWANIVNATEGVDRTWAYLLVSEADIKSVKGSWPSLAKVGR